MTDISDRLSSALADRYRIERPFPNVDDAVWQITTEGGVSPRWSPDGRELFYVELAQRGPSVRPKMMAVQIRPGDGFAWSGRQALFETADYVDANNAFLWDVSPLDGRFLMLKRLDSGKRPSLVMAENFTVELLQKLKR